MHEIAAYKKQGDFSIGGVSAPPATSSKRLRRDCCTPPSAEKEEV